MQPIRTGILCVPRIYEQTVQLVRQELGQHVAGVIMLREQSLASQRQVIEEVLRRWCDEEELDLLVTIGGTLPAPGPSPDEIVPEATLSVIERLVPGLAEEMRAYAREENVLALLDRGVVGLRGRSLILNLPAETAMAKLFLEAIVEVIAPLISHLQATNDVADPPAVEQGGQTGLQAAEFADFLRKRKAESE